MWYRAYVQDYGWLGWASDGARAGTTGIGYRVEALQVRVLAKGSAARPDGRRVQGPPIASEFGCSQRPLYNAEPRASDWLRVRCIDQCA